MFSVWESQLLVCWAFLLNLIQDHWPCDVGTSYTARMTPHSVPQVREYLQVGTDGQEQGSTCHISTGGLVKLFLLNYILAYCWIDCIPDSLPLCGNLLEDTCEEGVCSPPALSWNPTVHTVLRLSLPSYWE